MSSSVACRICLASNLPLEVIANTPQQEFYEKLTNSVLLDVNKPHHVCRICNALLKTFHGFTTKAIKSDQLLTQQIQNGALVFQPTSEFSSMTLTLTPIETIDIDPNSTDLWDFVTQEPIKCEGSTVENIVVFKTEDIAYEFEEAADETTNNLTSKSDSEDDVPLTDIIVKKELTQEDVTTKDDEVKTKKDDGFTLEECAEEVILTMEQMKQEFEARATSANYTSCPYKCDVCYKGFLDVNAFDNHRVKHDKTAGPHKCEICKMRYKKPRFLRTHIARAHRRRYDCVRCQHRSHTSSEARNHERWHRGFKYDCKLCGQQFSKPTSYLTHIRKNHPTLFYCTMCGDNCISRIGLRMHQRKAHSRKEISEDPPESAPERYCSKCDIQFLTKTAWSRHVLTAKVHKDEQDNFTKIENATKIHCKICSKTLESSEQLQTHWKEHERELSRLLYRKKPVNSEGMAACEQCSMKFHSKERLLRHVKRIHEGVKYVKQVVCEVCGHKCVSNAALIYHQRTHTGEKPYACATCSKRFVDSNQLKIHERIHTGERPYTCRVCEKRFAQKAALNRHMRVHTGVKPYTCQLCSKTFTQSNSLKLHIRCVHLKLSQKTDGVNVAEDSTPGSVAGTTGTKENTVD